MIFVENILSYTSMGGRVALRKIILLRQEKKVLYPYAKKKIEEKKVVKKKLKNHKFGV